MDAATAGALLSKVTAVTNRGGRYTSNFSFTPTQTGWHDILCHGAGGGSGGVKFTSGSGTIRSGGGEAGEMVRARMWLVKGAGPYTGTIGAAGTAGATTPTNGGNGGNTSFAGPDFTLTALGGAGSLKLSSSSSVDGVGATATARRDGNATAGQPSDQTGDGVWAGANGGTPNAEPGGYAGCFTGVTSVSRAGSGGCSHFAVGGGGASAANTSGSDGALGSGAGGSWTGSTTGIAGAAGGAGFIEIAFIGTN